MRTNTIAAAAAVLLIPTPYRTTLTMINGSKKIGQPNEIVGNA
jgi:hypothetical protein